MSKFNFQEYFDENKKTYYDSKYIITILESVLERDFDEIKSTVSNSKVLLTEEEIKTFLEQILVEEWC